jgi:hypothetical protein
MARHHGHRLSGTGNSRPLAAAMYKKTPHPFGHGAGYWWPTRPTSSTSSTFIVDRKKQRRSYFLRLTIRRNGLKDSFSSKLGNPRSATIPHLGN